MSNQIFGLVRMRCMLALACLLGPTVVLPAASDQASEVLLAKYFDAIGGRSVWAEGHGEYVLAKIRDPRFPLPGTFEFCFNWDKPQTADRLRVQDVTQYRVFTGSEGWTLNKPSGAQAGKLTDWDEARIQREFLAWADNLEVLTHQMAKSDPALSTRVGDGPWADWIAISRDQHVVAYLLLNEDGSPKRFRRLFDGTAVVFGPMANRGRLNFPATAAFESGEPFDLIAFEILDRAPLEPFQQPDAESAGDLHCR